MARLDTKNNKLDSYKNYDCVNKVVEYIMKNKENGENNRYVGGYGIPYYDKKSIVSALKFIKQATDKNGGKLLLHYNISFSPKEKVDAELAYRIGWKVASVFKDRYQILFSVHEDTKLPHIHFMLNSVSFANGKKFNIKRPCYKGFCRYIEELADPKKIEEPVFGSLECFLK